MPRTATTARATVRAEATRSYEQAAHAAGLRYVRDDAAGWRRLRRGKTFVYVTASGARINHGAALTRIRKLAIPPAWERVWICPQADGHIQATGRDARGRKQYRYHAEFGRERDRHKYDRMFQLARALPKIRAACHDALRLPHLPRTKVVAAIITLLEQTLIRVGNEEYARTNQSYGLTTLRDHHVTIRGAALHFHFRGKSGIGRHVLVRDARLATIVARCKAVRGHLLFQYIDDDGAAHAVSSADVNAFLREVTGSDITAKDIRTFHGTRLAALALQALGRCASQRASKRAIVAALRITSTRLGNTPAVCRRAYVHPVLLTAYADGSVMPKLRLVTDDAHAEREAQERTLVAYLRRCNAQHS